MPGAVYSPAACIQLTLKTARETGFPIDRLIFEITEGEEVVDRKHLCNIVEEYRRRGFFVAMDDFGAGYSGMNLLADFPTDVIKLDMDLTRNLPNRPPPPWPSSAAWSSSPKSSAASSWPRASKRWRNTPPLRSCGVTLMQGYLLARPAFESLPAFEIPTPLDIPSNYTIPFGPHHLTVLAS